MEKERQRRRFSDEYKAETVRVIQRSGKSIGKMALKLGIGLKRTSGMNIEMPDLVRNSWRWILELIVG